MKTKKINIVSKILRDNSVRVKRYKSYYGSIDYGIILDYGKGNGMEIAKITKEEYETLKREGM